MTPKSGAIRWTPPQRRDRDVGLALLVSVHELQIIHLVDVIAGQDHDIFGALFFERVDILIDRVGGPLVPVLVDALLRRHDVDELAQLAAQVIAPAEIDVPVEAHRFVLREHQHLAQPAVQAVREREVDDAIGTAEGDGRLRAITRQRLESRTFAPRQDDCQYAFHPCVSDRA